MSKPVDPRLVRHVPAARPLVAALAALQAAGAALVVAQAVLLADVVVTLFGGHAGVSDVLGRLIALAAVGIGRAAVAGGQEWVTTRGSVRLRAQLRRTTLAAIVRLGPGWADRQEPGRLVNATGPGLDALDGYVSRALPALVSACVVPPVVLFWILLTDWQSGLIFILLLPLVPLFMVLIGITTNRLVERQYRVLARLAGQFLDLLRGLTTLRIYGQAETQEGTLRKSTEAYRRQTMATLRIAFLSGLVLDLIAALSIAIVAVEIGLRLDGGHVTFATALLVLLLAPELFAPLRAVGAQHHASQEGAAAAAAALDIVDEAPDDLAAAPGPAPAPIRPTGRVELTGLTIDYPGRTEPAVDDLDLVIEAGEVVALTGPSGAGKSTVLAAVLGFVAPTDGRVTVGTADGPMSAAALDAGAWRDNVAWLPQRPRPSQATVADEIRLGDQDADPAAIAAAGQTCHAPDPDVALGEDGRSVSAGQRRRIALARVLLRARAVRAAGGVPIVLLDEPSEDLDRETETVVASVISDLAGWASVVVATHSTVLAALADVQIRIADGRIAERVVQPQPVRERAGAVPAAERVPVTASAIGPVAAREPAARPARRYRLRDLAREAGATRRLALAVAFSALAALSGLGLMASSMWLISRAAQHPNVQALAIAVVGVRTFAISRALLRYAERLSSHDGALRMLSALRVRVFAALRPLSPDVLGAYGRGDLLRRFVGDVDGAQEGLVRALIPLSGALAGALGAVVIATALTPIAGVALAVGLAVAGVAVPALSFRAAGSGAALVRLAGDRDRRSSALLDALGEVVAYGAAERAVDEVAHVDTELAGAVRRPGRAAASGAFGGGTIAALTLSTVLAAAADAASSGQLSVVNVGVLAVCVLVGFESVSTLPAAFVAWARCRAGLERVSEVTSAEPVFVDPAVPAAVPHTCVGLRAASIDLAPAPGARAVLRGADLDLAPGARIAVVGPSGCGKSTLLTAALRMLPVQRGTLSLTGPGQSVDLSDARAADVPPVIAGSLQGDHVFDATLRDNLRVVRPAASDSDLDAVARRAGLRELIATLPEGWSTPAGPDGAALSGGQRQRLLLARALLADPAVLVLDEPTAHLDADTERRVLDDLLDATAGRTVLMTTHRRLSDGRVDAVLRVSDRALVADAEACAEPCPA